MAPGKMAIYGAAALGAFALFGHDAAFTMPPAGQRGALRGGSTAYPAEKAQKAAQYELTQPEKTAAVEEPVAASSNFLRTALAVVAALAVAIAPMADAQAARSGGRMGGGGMRMGGMGGGAARRMAPGPRVGARTNSNVNIGVGVAPPIYGSPFGMGYGFGMPLFAPPLFGPSIALGGGSSAADQQLQNQQRQDERVIDQQKSQIEQMQKEIAELKGSQQK